MNGRSIGVFTLAISITILSLAALILPGDANPAVANASDAPLPWTNWVYKDIDTLAKAGIYIAHRGSGDGADVSPNDIAYDLRCLAPLIEMPASGDVSTDPTFEPRQELHRDLDDNADALDAINDLLNGFVVQVAETGTDVSALRRSIVTLQANEASRSARLVKSHKQIDNAGPLPEWCCADIRVLNHDGVTVDPQSPSALPAEISTTGDAIRLVERLLPLLHFDASSLAYNDPLAAEKMALGSKTEAINAFYDLVCGLATQLKAGSMDVDGVKLRLDSMLARSYAIREERNRIRTINPWVNMQVSSEYTAFADTPENHWVFDALNVLHKAGFTVGSYSVGDIYNSTSRRIIADNIAAILPLLWPDPTVDYGHHPIPFVNPLLQLRADASPDVVVSLLRLVDGFRPDLLSIGVNVAAAKFRLQSFNARQIARQMRN